MSIGVFIALILLIFLWEYHAIIFTIAGIILAIESLFLIKMYRDGYSALARQGKLDFSFQATAFRIAQQLIEVVLLVQWLRPAEQRMENLIFFTVIFVLVTLFSSGFFVAFDDLNDSPIFTYETMKGNLRAVDGKYDVTIKDDHLEISQHYEGDPDRTIYNRSHHYILRFILNLILPVHIVPFHIFYYRIQEKLKSNNQIQVKK